MAPHHVRAQGAHSYCSLLLLTPTACIPLSLSLSLSRTYTHTHTHTQTHGRVQRLNNHLQQDHSNQFLAISSLRFFLKHVGVYSLDCLSACYMVCLSLCSSACSQAADAETSECHQGHSRV